MSLPGFVHNVFLEYDHTPPISTFWALLMEAVLDRHLRLRCTSAPDSFLYDVCSHPSTKTVELRTDSLMYVLSFTDLSNFNMCLGKIIMTSVLNMTGLLFP